MMQVLTYDEESAEGFFRQDSVLWCYHEDHDIL